MYFYDDSIPAPGWMSSKADRGSLGRMKFYYLGGYHNRSGDPEDGEMKNSRELKEYQKEG